MGRRADPPGVQAAKGNSNRRKSATEKREAEVAEVAEVLANGPADAAGMPPRFANDPLYAGAREIWNELAPQLTRTHRLRDDHRLLFAVFCCNMADWIRLDRKLLDEGETQTVETVAGGPMIRDHPAGRRRQQALDNVLKLSPKFGLTPHDEYQLFKDQAMAAMTNPGLFGDHLPKSERKPEGDSGDATGDESAIGAFGKLNSDPPATSTRH